MGGRSTLAGASPPGTPVQNPRMKSPPGSVLVMQPSMASMTSQASLQMQPAYTIAMPQIIPCQNPYQFIPMMAPYPFQQAGYPTLPHGDTTMRRTRRATTNGGLHPYEYGHHSTLYREQNGRPHVYQKLGQNAYSEENLMEEDRQSRRSHIYETMAGLRRSSSTTNISQNDQGGTSAMEQRSLYRSKSEASFLSRDSNTLPRSVAQVLSGSALDEVHV